MLIVALVNTRLKLRDSCERYPVSDGKYSVENGTLVIRNPNLSGIQSYKCEATNEAGTVYITFQTNGLRK